MTDQKDEPKKIAILGSTGSIGKQALEVVAEQPGRFQVEVLTAGNNADLLIQQALQFQPNAVVIGEEAHYEKVKTALWDAGVKVYAGRDALNQIVESTEIDMVLTALVGSAGLEPTVRAIRSGKQIALANKETLVVAGEIVTELARKHAVNIYPVDSEHSAIFQCLVGEWNNPIEKIILTASGGPFRGRSREQLMEVTREQALKHPNWSMGAKITIDSATLMNKGLEVIEAKWLFHLKPEQIEVVVHPQSIIHSIVQFTDGSMKAQLGLPDMKLPIQYAMAYPQRLTNAFPRFDFTKYAQLTFEQPDLDTFRCLQLAYQAMAKGGTMPCVLNAANEMAVADFLADRITFLQIADRVEEAMQNSEWIAKPAIEDYYFIDAETRRLYSERHSTVQH
jgi:1-deoxy-D-xylulose-5-phosphate reductoisomerase